MHEILQYCPHIGIQNDYRLAIGRIPIVVARHPRQITGERGEEEAQAPSNDDIVEEIHVEGDQNDSVADA